MLLGPPQVKSKVSLHLVKGCGSNLELHKDSQGRWPTSDGDNPDEESVWILVGQDGT